MKRGVTSGGDRARNGTDGAGALVARAAKGDRAAFARLYQRTSPQLFCLCVRLVRRERLAEDVLREAYLRIWRDAGDFDPEIGSAMSWMAGVVRGLALDRLYEIYGGEPPSLPAGNGNGQEAARPAPNDLSGNAQLRSLHASLERMDALQRQSLLLAYYQGYTRRELARRMDTPLGTVKRSVRSALQRLGEGAGP